MLLVLPEFFHGLIPALQLQFLHLKRRQVIVLEVEEVNGANGAELLKRLEQLLETPTVAWECWMISGVGPTVRCEYEASLLTVPATLRGRIRQSPFPADVTSQLPTVADRSQSPVG